MSGSPTWTGCGKEQDGVGGTLPCLGRTTCRQPAHIPSMPGSVPSASSLLLLLPPPYPASPRMISEEYLLFYPITSNYELTLSARCENVEIR